MCGFAGFVVTDALRATSDPQRVAERMGDRIKHRGPDDAAYYIDERVALAFRRLSIIDLEGGRQPIESEDGSCVLVLNGEIYNYRELRAELVKRGHVFKTHADSEVVLHGFEEYGRAVLDRLRGMFAFVIWDKRNDVLFGARDIFGIKPLYCYQRGGEFMFASEIKSFLAHPRFLCELERAHIATYLSYEYIPNEQTLFKSVQKVLPAHWFEWDVRTKSFSTGCYYEMRYRVDERLTLDEWAQRIDEALSESVAAHLVSDVEVGGFLSSGVDSSYLVERVLHAGGAEGAGASGVGAAAAEGASAVGAAGVGGAKAGGLRTFSVGYADERFSELPAAQRLARELGVECVANTVSADEFFGAMPAIQYHMDEPLPNPSENPLYFLCENAARQVKVVLSGEGADELFGGYPNYSQECATAAYERCVPRFLRRLAGAAAGGLPSFKGQHFLVRGAVEPWQRNSRANYVFEESECRRFLRSSAETQGPRNPQSPQSPQSPQELSKRYFDEATRFGADAVTQLQYADIKTWLPYDILLKADRMSMAHSLELRVPYLDRRVLEVCLTLPTNFRVRGNTSKVALRKAASRRLPEYVWKREKLGFPSPLATWLREDRYYQMVRAAFEGATAREFFVTSELMRLLNEHRSGKVSHMQKIWSFYTFIVWHEQFF